MPDPVLQSNPFKIIIITLFSIFFNPVYSQELNYPVDIAWHEGSGKFYVSNWSEGNGNILVMNAQGTVESYFVQGLSYAGGLCIVDDVLYVVNNTGLYNTGLPCFLEGINISTGTQVLHFEVADGGAYLDKVVKGRNGKLYISDSGLGKIYAYNLLSGAISTITEPGNSNYLYSICYDEYDDRIVFTYSTYTSSFIQSVSPDGGDISSLAFYDGYLENLIMEADGDFYVSSWGQDEVFGNEYIFRYNHSFSEKVEASAGHNRPFGMYKNETENELVVCNWGGNTISFVDLTLIGIMENGSLNTLDIYPLPASGTIHLDVTGLTGPCTVLEIVNMNGKKILSQNIISNKNDGIISVDISTLSKGMYIARITNKGHIYQGKFMVKH